MVCTVCGQELMKRPNHTSLIMESSPPHNDGIERYWKVNRGYTDCSPHKNFTFQASRCGSYLEKHTALRICPRSAEWHATMCYRFKGHTEVSSSKKEHRLCASKPELLSRQKGFAGVWVYFDNMILQQLWKVKKTPSLKKTHSEESGHCRNQRNIKLIQRESVWPHLPLQKHCIHT